MITVLAVLCLASAAADSVDMFWGSGAVNCPVSEGMARGWNWEKAQTGNTHPGAVLPFGWVSVCAYTGGYASGYGRCGSSSSGPAPVPDARKYAWGITHFQHSGTGWINKFYNYLRLTPFVEGADRQQRSRLDDEVARPGYYAARLTDYRAAFELTASAEAAAHRFKFDAAGGWLKVDLRQIGLDCLHVMADCTDSGYQGERIADCRATKVADDAWSGFIVANGVKLYYAIRATGELDWSRAWKDEITFKVKGRQLETYIGFSRRSAEAASARAMAAQTVGFDGLRQAAAANWEAILDRVQVEFADLKLRSRFYSALYHSCVKPSRCDEGFVDFSTFWDIYRTELPLVLTLDAATGRGILEHILAKIETLGFSPICQIMDDVVVHKDMQATALSVYALTDGYFRGHLGQADYPRLKRAFDREFAHADIGGMSPTHVLDMAGAYGAAAFVAADCGDGDYAQALRERAAIWRTVYDADTGLLRAPAKYYEGNQWNYSFRPHPGMAGRVALAGGQERFCALLDRFFAIDSVPADWSAAKDRVRRPDHFEGLNNECDMDAPYAYLWCGRADRTAEVVDAVRRYRFADGEGGCPGNNDSGATGSWYVWNCLGLYPLTGTPYYLLATPSVDSATWQFARGRLTIGVKRESAASIYPVAWRFNGRSLAGPWIRVTELEQGGRLEFELRDRPPAAASAVPAWLD